MTNKFHIYDIETYPNFFSAQFVCWDTSTDEKKFHIFIISDDRDDSIQLKSYLKKVEYLVGYNSTGFDDILLKAIIHGGVTDPARLYKIAMSMVNDDYAGYKRYKWARQSWVSVDLAQHLSVGTYGYPSLKKVAIHLRMPTIQDLPISPSTQLTAKQKEQIVEYCWVDVRVTYALLKVLLPGFEMRKALSSEYKVDLFSASNSKIGKTILTSLYGEPKIQKTTRPIIRGKDLLPRRDTYRFDSDVLRGVEGAIHDLKLTGEKPAFELLLTLDEIEYTIALGGIHSNDSPGAFRSTEDEDIILADVSSHYPNTIILNNIAPAHLDVDRYIKMYSRLVKDRITAKKSGNKVRANSLKISINSAFGLMGYPGWWLYDKQALYRTTIGGQIYLLDLIEKLVLAGFKVISANTDGVFVKVPKVRYNDYLEVCNDWEHRTTLSLDHDRITIYARKDVNNYLSLIGDKIKTKGVFFDKLHLDPFSLTKGYNAPIIALALQAYFISNTEPSEFIRGHTDAHHFFTTQKAGKAFKLYARTFAEDGVTARDVLLQKTNRYYVAKDGVYLVKKHADGREISILKGKKVGICNDINNADINMIDMDHYINATQEIIDRIEGKGAQMKLFEEVKTDGWELLKS